jgi:uncharacterized membrane protein (DUF485 family)
MLPAANGASGGITGNEAGPCTTKHAREEAPMKPDILVKIEQNPKYQQLVKSRTRFAVILSLIMIAVYFAFILLVAFAPGVLGTPIGGSVITVGIPVGIFIILFAFALTGVYVARANTEFDRLTRQIVEETK